MIPADETAATASAASESSPAATGSPPLAAMFTVSAPDGELTTEVFVAERAWAFTDTPVLIGFGVNAPHSPAHRHTGELARRQRDRRFCADATRR